MHGGKQKGMILSCGGMSDHHRENKIKNKIISYEKFYQQTRFGLFVSGNQCIHLRNPNA
jgi:hypothetical protein